MASPHSTAPERERVLTVGVESPVNEWPVAESLAELARLVDTDGGEVVASETQRLARPVPKTYIGSGKVQQIKQLADELDIDVVLFDDELSPSQQANLERILGDGVKVIDRTALILDIFAKHATTHEGRLQVRLAQSQYLLPRLRGMWSHLVREQTRGGIGSRFGQGESQLEVDRRLVRKRIASLRQELERLDRRRSLQSKARWESGVYRVALVGYTNAGKSTLLNALTGSAAYVQDELFATLDPTTRSLDLEEGRKITLTDTVGFVQKLPTLLVESFKSTLAEVMAADLILLVVDASDANATKEIDTVRQVLSDIGASHIESVLVYNKCDMLSEDALRDLRMSQPQAECISALQKTGLSSLRYRISKEASAGDTVLTVCVPYHKGMLMRMVHERCQVVREEYGPEGLVTTVWAGRQMAQVLEPYVVGEDVAQALQDAAQKQ